MSNVCMSPLSILNYSVFILCPLYVVLLEELSITQVFALCCRKSGQSNQLETRLINNGQLDSEIFGLRVNPSIKSNSTRILVEQWGNVKCKRGAKINRTQRSLKMEQR